MIHYDNLLQNVTAILLQNVTEVYYKMRQDFYFKMRQFYYKMWQLLQIATILLQNAIVITNCDSTHSYAHSIWEYLEKNLDITACVTN